VLIEIITSAENPIKSFLPLGSINAFRSLYSNFDDPINLYIYADTKLEQPKLKLNKSYYCYNCFKELERMEELTSRSFSGSFKLQLFSLVF